jgi:hypothetical protein
MAETTARISVIVIAATLIVGAAFTGAQSTGRTAGRKRFERTAKCEKNGEW